MSAFDEAETRFTPGRWLALARVAWLALAVLTLALFAASLPAHYAQVQTPCPTAVCEDGRLAPVHARALESFGLSLGSYAAYSVGLEALFAAVYVVVAIVIFARKSDDWLGLFAALALLTFGLATFPTSLSSLAAAHSGWWLPVQFITWLGSVSILIFFYLFPTGQFVPRWTRWLAILWAARETFHYFFPASPFNPNNWPTLLDSAVFTGFVGSGVLAQLYRYVRVSGPVERQQTKWVVFGVTAGIGGLLGLAWLVTGLPGLEESPNPFILLTVGSAFTLFPLLVPLSIGIAILRYRLWDIDVIIRRTLIYALLSGLLALAYFASVVLLQGAFQALTGEGQNQLVTVLSTLAIAALFLPLRQRVQTFIDRRFYRQKYDAQRVLAQFAATARDETDLEKLSAQLVDVVQETMQPESLSLWLRKPEVRR
jgi:hypothetical protein